jgi:hypothetical protein
MLGQPPDGLTTPTKQMWSPSTEHIKHALRPFAGMKGEFSESTFRRTRYGSVRLQQGRVQMDADWSEGLDVRVREDVVCLDVWERDVGATEDHSVVAADAGGPDTSAREGKEDSGDWCLRLTRKVAKTGGATSEVQFTLGRVDTGSIGPLILPEPEVSVDGVPWRRVGSFLSAGPNDNVYVLKQNPDSRGSSSIEFGDGKNGARPATGARVTAGYRLGAGKDGNKPWIRANRDKPN